MNLFDALLLVGPTGSGKTPLGDLLEARGVWHKRCHHFDFGANLRKIVATHEMASFFTKHEIDVVTHALNTGQLLENENFGIAGKILVLFAEENNCTSDDLIVLNGFPRHEGQAEAMDGLVNIRILVYLESTVKVVQERIRYNSGGDRAERQDDSLQAIAKRLRIFHKRTIPLLDFYESKKVQINKVQVDVNTTPDEIHRLLNALPCPFV
jgi:adenylate kinase